MAAEGMLKRRDGAQWCTFGGFIVAMGVAGIIPAAAVVALTGLELVVAFLQAYVFAILSCIYLNDALHMH